MTEDGFKEDYITRETPFGIQTIWLKDSPKHKAKAGTSFIEPYEGSLPPRPIKLKKKYRQQA